MASPVQNSLSLPTGSTRAEEVRGDALAKEGGKAALKGGAASDDRIDISSLAHQLQSVGGEGREHGMMSRDTALSLVAEIRAQVSENASEMFSAHTEKADKGLFELLKMPAA